MTMQKTEGLVECLHSCRLLAFDVDGTLTDSIDQIITCFQRTFTHAGLPVPDPEAIKGTIGMSLPLGIQKLLPDPSDSRLGAEVTQLYKDTFTVSRDLHVTKLFPGVIELLSELQEAGFIMAIASGKSRVGVMRVLDDIPALKPFFPYICTGDQCESKPSPMMLQILAAQAQVPLAETMGIGDAILDIKMCRNAKCHELGVMSGVCDAYDFMDNEVEFYIPKITDLRNYLH